jgi:hypothetical protein
LCASAAVTVNHHNREGAMPDITLTPKSVRIADDEAKWLSTAATKGGVTQNDLLRLALHRLRKELGAASRIKPEAVSATARASRYKLTPPRATATTTPVPKTGAKASRNGKATSAKAPGRRRASRSRAA